MNPKDFSDAIALAEAYVNATPKGQQCSVRFLALLSASSVDTRRIDEVEWNTIADILDDPALVEAAADYFDGLLGEHGFEEDDEGDDEDDES